MNTLAAGFAHEIRNPLSTLNMNLQLLQEEWENPITEREKKSRKKIDVLLREAKRLEDMLNDLLRFAAGHELRLASLPLNDLVKELLELLAPQIEQSRIRVTQKLDPNLPAIQCDENLLRGALFNILTNAQQAMPKGGNIEVRTQRNGRHILLSIRDSGKGIPPEDLDKIFHLYFSTKPGGTGLGLPLAKRIIEEHGGQIEVESRPGEGTTFLVRLPL